MQDIQQISNEIAVLEERRRLALSLGGVGIWDWNLLSGQLYWDDEMLKIYGISREEFCGCYEDFKNRVHPDDILMVEAQVKNCYEKNEPYIYRFRVKRGTGWCVVSGFGNCIRNEEGIPVRMVGVNVYEGDLCEEHEQRFCRKDPCPTCPTRRFKNF